MSKERTVGDFNKYWDAVMLYSYLTCKQASSNRRDGKSGRCQGVTAERHLHSNRWT